MGKENVSLIKIIIGQLPLDRKLTVNVHFKELQYYGLKVWQRLLFIIVYCSILENAIGYKSVYEGKQTSNIPINIS